MIDSFKLIRVNDLCLAVVFLSIFFLSSIDTRAQQFNTDNDLAMSHGTATITMTAGGAKRRDNIVFCLSSQMVIFCPGFLVLGK